LYEYCYCTFHISTYQYHDLSNFRVLVVFVYNITVIQFSYVKHVYSQQMILLQVTLWNFDQSHYCTI